MGIKEQGHSVSFESRFPAIATTLSVLLLLAFMPARIRLFPQWAFFVWSAMALVPMIAVTIVADKTIWFKVERAGILLFCLTCEVNICLALRSLFDTIVYRPDQISGIQLLASSVAVWVTNVMAFTLLYWQVDRGGPQGRYAPTKIRADWHFPNQDFADEVGSDWQPKFVDYLFLGFSTSTAFSMTEAVPLTPRAKMLMMAQSLISLITIVIVGARAINILGS